MEQTETPKDNPNPLHSSQSARASEDGARTEKGKQSKVELNKRPVGGLKDTEPSSPENTEKEEPHSNAYLLWLVGIICAGAAFWSWYDAQQSIAAIREEVAEKVLDNEKILRDNGGRLNEMRTQLTELTGRVLKLDEQSSDLVAQQATLEQYYKGVVQQDSRRLLNDIDHLFMVASQALQLSGDISTAISALETADSILSQADNQARYVPLRKAIANDLVALKALPEVDVTGLTIKLDQLMQSANSLPLIVDTVTQKSKSAKEEVATQQPAWRTFLSDVWHEIRQLVQIRRINNPDAALVSPDQAFFVRENLKLRLLSARVDVLSRTDSGYHQDLDAAAALINQYFDTKNPKTVAALNQIAQLQRTQLQEKLPSLNASYSALRQLTTNSWTPEASSKGAS